MISCLIVAHLSGATINVTFRFCTSVGLTFRNQKLFAQRTAKNYPIVSEFKSRQGVFEIYSFETYTSECIYIQIYKYIYIYIYIYIHLFLKVFQFENIDKINIPFLFQLKRC